MLFALGTSPSPRKGTSGFMKYPSYAYPDADPLFRRRRLREAFGDVLRERMPGVVGADLSWM